MCMKKASALSLRQSLGKILAQLARSGEPVLIEQRQRPAAVLISLEDYQKRFVDREADEQRRRIVERIKRASLRSDVPVNEIIRDGRR